MFLKKLLPLLGVLLSINTLGAAENETPAPFYLWGGSGTTTPIGVTNITLPDGTPKTQVILLYQAHTIKNLHTQDLLTVLMG